MGLDRLVRVSSRQPTSAREHGPLLVYTLGVCQTPGPTPMFASDYPSPVQQGQILAGKYRVDRVLGAGGMGVVVAATHVELGQRVAIKFLLPAAMSVPDSRERFTREARAAATLRSDHVARVVDVGTLHDGVPYMIMEFLEGCDLAQLLANKGPLPIEDAVGFVLQACDAVSEAHAHGIVHRDLKPSNLFLTRKANGAAHIKVLDFGISKSTKIVAEALSLTKTSDVIGSPIYMAPEQIRSARDVDERTDIWAIGVILYELLSGRVPFPAQNVPQLCAMVLEKEPTPISGLRSDVPYELGAAVMRCLAKDPSQRFESITDVMRALFPFAPAPAASGLIRSEPPAPGLYQSASVGSLDRPSQEWAETLAGPHPPGSPPHVLLASVDVSPQHRLEPSGPGGASVTLPASAGAESRRAVPIAIFMVAALVFGGVGLAGIAWWATRNSATQAPTPAASSAQTVLSAPPVASAPAPDAIAMPPSSATSVATSPPTVEVSALPSRPPRTASPPSTAAAPPVTATGTQPPAGDFLPDERK